MMAGTSKIEWTESTWNPIVGLAPDHILFAPLKRNKPTTYFVNSMGDLFHEDCPDEWIDRVFAIMALCPQHTFQVLTKRAERMREYVSRKNGDSNRYAAQHRIWIKLPKVDEWSTGAKVPPWPLPNVWLGVSAERQQEADERIPHLRDTPAAVRFVSFEPLLGHIEPDLRGIHWAIVGGESGTNARPMHPKWARRLRNLCVEHGVAYFFKQWGAFAPFSDADSKWLASTPPDDPGFDDDNGIVSVGDARMMRVGKKAAGRLLDGLEWNQMPEVHHA